MYTGRGRNVDNEPGKKEQSIGDIVMTGEQPDALKRLVIVMIALAILGTVLALGAIYLLPAIDPAIPLNKRLIWRPK